MALPAKLASQHLHDAVRVLAFAPRVHRCVENENAPQGLVLDELRDFLVRRHRVVRDPRAVERVTVVRSAAHSAAERDGR